MKKLLILFVLLLVAAGLYFVLRPTPLTTVKIGDQNVYAEMADKKAEQELGLMNRESLEADHGMLFVYSSTNVPVFWMKNMLISLDMIFIGPDKTINHIIQNIPPCTEENDENCPTYHSPEPTQYILEVNAGYAQAHQIKVGDSVEF